MLGWLAGAAPTKALAQPCKVLYTVLHGRSTPMATSGGNMSGRSKWKPKTRYTEKPYSERVAHVKSTG